MQKLDVQTHRGTPLGVIGTTRNLKTVARGASVA